MNGRTRASGRSFPLRECAAAQGVRLCMIDGEFLRAFEHTTLPLSLWTHEAHVRMAWLYLRARPWDAALEAIRLGVQRYNASLGKSAAYHETVTCAYARVIRARIAARPELGAFDAFRAANADLFDRESPPLLRHYRRDTILSERARAAFVEPDLEPLP